MTTLHTPGPWSWCGNDLDSADYKEVISSEVRCGAFCYGGCVSMKVSDADRALIAAAPDLLAALEAMLEYTADLNAAQGDNDCDAVKLAFAAVARATSLPPTN